MRVRRRASGVSWNDLLLGRAAAAVGAATDGDDDDAEGAQPQPVVALLRQQHPPRSSRAPLWPFLLVDRATDASRVALAASVVGAAAAVAWCRRRSSSSRCGVGGSSSEAGAPALDLVTTPSSRPRAAPREGTWTARLATDACGRAAETHAVTTPDGYVVRLIRIRGDRGGGGGAARIALFQHGLLDSSAAWVSTGSVFSLGSRAAEAGFDVWLANFRGTNDSAEFSPAYGAGPPAVSGASRRAFWQYCVDDHVLDVVAAVDAIRRIRREESERNGAAADAAAPGIVGVGAYVCTCATVTAL